ncbi:MAG: type II toxin-antitoxin system Phd/YefM family antitoxin [Bryobacteraceae bacterium]
MKPRKRPTTRSVPAGEFKATCLALMDEVESRGTEIIITKHRRPVAKLAPVSQPVRVPFVNRSPGVIQASSDDALVAPEAPDWEVDADF